MFTYQIEDHQVTVTGYDGTVSYLQIPPELEDCPVTAVAHSAFAHREDLCFVQLPQSLRRVERFAFYSCLNLTQLRLYDGICDYYDGAFGQCRALHEIELDLSGGGFTVLRDLLADSDREIRFLLHLPKGDARLTFPDYLAEYQEDTRARAIHMHIEGAGFSFRECVGRNGIDFRGYDRLFDRIRYQPDAPAVQTALDRLCFPYGLEEPERRIYEAYLAEHAREAVEALIRQDDPAWTALLIERNLLDPAAAKHGAELAAEAGRADLVAALMPHAAVRKSARLEL